jgi:hypothetical protein
MIGTWYYNWYLVLELVRWNHSFNSGTLVFPPPEFMF